MLTERDGTVGRLTQVVQFIFGNKKCSWANSLAIEVEITVFVYGCAIIFDLPHCVVGHNYVMMSCYYSLPMFM